ncbi:MAG: oligopeptide:H+ symporter, partial [Thermoguttaceae bacterium]
EPNSISQHVLYLAGYKLDKDDFESLLGELKKYPGAKKKLNDMLARTNTLYNPEVGKVTTFPATWYQSVNALGIVIFAPIFAFMWVYLAGKGIQPSTPVKFGIGLLLLSTSFMVMVPGAIQSANTNGLAGAYWLLLSYMLATWGELCLSPVGLSMVTKLSPVRYASLLMGVWFLSSALANYLSGILAAWFGTSEDGSSPLNIIYGKAGGMADFFVIMALIPAVAGVIVLCLAPMLKKMMHGIK